MKDSAQEDSSGDAVEAAPTTSSLLASEAVKAARAEDVVSQVPAKGLVEAEVEVAARAMAADAAEAVLVQVMAAVQAVATAESV